MTVPFWHHAELTPLARAEWYYDDDGSRFLVIAAADVYLPAMVGTVTGARSGPARGVDDFDVGVG